MLQFCTFSLIQVWMFFIMLFSITFSTGTDISLEELRELKLNFKKLETKLERKVYQLGEKVTQLEAKNTQLENKVQQQDLILISLLVQINQSESATGSKSVSNNHQTAIQSTGKISRTLRTCGELRADDPSLPSGMYWIDPDGQNVGDSPIYVYCDMTSGSTSILHDSESAIDVGHCAEPGCYSLSINYNAPFKQIKALAELSTECHQSIKYECFHAPFEFDNVAYSWWNDRNGNKQYFWAGDNAGRIHTCQCGIDGNCVVSSLKCNCNTRLPIEEVDDGVITDKNVLPITQLNFGRTQTSSGIHTLGRFECTGRIAVNGLPRSCKDLWLIGHTLNGVYSVRGVKMMESVYCDFSKLPSDAGFQKWIGYTDIKSAPVYFYVQRNNSFRETSTPIPFHVALVNEGNAMDLTSGIFTAPRPGTYFFSFTGQVEFPASSSQVDLYIAIYLNRVQIGIGEVEEANNVAYQNDQGCLCMTVVLTTGLIFRVLCWRRKLRRPFEILAILQCRTVPTSISISPTYF